MQLMQIVQMNQQIFEIRYGGKSPNTDNTTYIFTLMYNAILKSYNNIVKGSVTGIVISSILILQPRILTKISDT